MLTTMHYIQILVMADSPPALSLYMNHTRWYVSNLKTNAEEQTTEETLARI